MSGSGPWFSGFACAGEGWLPLVAFAGMPTVQALMHAQADDGAAAPMDAPPTVAARSDRRERVRASLSAPTGVDRPS